MESISIKSQNARLQVTSLQGVFLFCGVLSTLWYTAVNIIVPFQYPGYDTASQTVSELSAMGAPTRSLWLMLLIPFSLLVIAFGCGVWLLGNHSKWLRLAGAVIVVDAIFGAFWPPMHQREVIAAGGGTTTDSLHVTWAYIHLVFMILMMVFGAAALGKHFRIYTVSTFITYMVFGLLTILEGPGIAAGAPTPHIGIWERINMGAYMLWVVVFAITLIRIRKKP
jgi:hypothetical protein